MIPTIFLLGTSWAFSVAWVRHQQNLMPAEQPLQQSLENPNQQKLLFCHCSAYIKSHPNMLESFAICDCFEPPFVVKKWLYLVASIGWRVEPFFELKESFLLKPPRRRRTGPCFTQSFHPDLGPKPTLGTPRT